VETLRTGLPLCIVSLAALCLRTGSAQAAQTVDFARDVRPVLSDRCFLCHGPDAETRKAGLRLDTVEGLFKPLAGDVPVVPGKPLQSTLYQRLIAHDPDDRMPPADSRKQVSSDEAELIRLWIEQGGKTQTHWAYKALPSPSPRMPSDGSVIDTYIQSQLESRGLSLSPAASKVTLARRLYLDLTGLPANPDQIDAFVRDRRPSALRNLVASLLASARYGERMATHWLDLVRFADTMGYHSDLPRSVWPYRDYVIAAFNKNKPFDTFTIEQLAGDQLVNPTSEQLVASTYNMLNLATEEGGAQPAEYQARYMADRVRNVSSVWLGSTVGCAECHDHKYDPITQRDFYSLGAFFSDLRELPTYLRAEHHYLWNAATEKRRVQLQAAQRRAQLSLQNSALRFESDRMRWESNLREGIRQGRPIWERQTPVAVDVRSGSVVELAEGGEIRTISSTSGQEEFRVDIKPKGAVAGLRLEIEGEGESGNKAYARFVGNIMLSRVRVQRVRADKSVTDVAVRDVVADYEQDGFWVAGVLDEDKETGWSVNGHRRVLLDDWAPVHRLVLQLDQSVSLAEGEQLRVLLSHDSVQHPGEIMARFRLETTAWSDARAVAFADANDETTLLLKKYPEDRSPSDSAAVTTMFQMSHPGLQLERRKVASLRDQMLALTIDTPHTLHTIATDPRPVKILGRGNWQDQTGQLVQPAVPVAFGSLPATPNRPGRLDLAKWLVSRQNPLTARVFVNRLWRLFFGKGLAQDTDDLGAQGGVPSYPELLDQLAADFVHNGWNVKALVTQIVSSKAYQQRTVVEENASRIDPDNSLLSRQRTFRIDAEFVRDTVFSVAGVLNPKIGGPSVKPWQPDSYWDQLNFPRRHYDADVGPAAYRRGLYTHWQRSYMHPSLMAFDAPARESCQGQRSVSNTPQQALVLLNDPQHFAAAEAFAARLLNVAQGDEARVEAAFRLAVGRSPEKQERAVLLGLLKTERIHLAEDSKSQDKAWVSAARVVLNLGELVIRP
jgi:hypothetical protein